MFKFGKLRPYWGNTLRVRTSLLKNGVLDGGTLGVGTDGNFGSWYQRYQFSTCLR